jgi:predicted nuclease of restriction endonuclease-like (RecB) superfamily
MNEELNLTGFGDWLIDIKSKIHEAQRKVAFSINSQLIELYWDIGKSIAEKQEKANWGSSFIEKVATELKHEFPRIKGFSRRNLYTMSQWYKFYSQKYQFVPQLVAQIPWSHNRLIITKVKNVEEAEFYCLKTIENGWDRYTLEIQITKNLFEKSAKVMRNFENTLSVSQSKLAEQTLKDPYNFDFLGLEDDAIERAIEDELTKHIT